MQNREHVKNMTVNTYHNSICTYIKMTCKTLLTICTYSDNMKHVTRRFNFICKFSRMYRQKKRVDVWRHQLLKVYITYDFGES